MCSFLFRLLKKTEKKNISVMVLTIIQYKNMSKEEDSATYVQRGHLQSTFLLLSCILKQSCFKLKLTFCK